MKKAAFLSGLFIFILFQTYAQSALFTTDSPRCANDTMHFTPDPPGGIILMETWDFGDGIVNTYLPPASLPVFATHLYASPGTYTVTRTVKFSTGSVSSNHLVQVLAHPVAGFSNSNVTCAGQAVQFTDLSQINGGGNIQSWRWNFGDPATGLNNTSTLQNPSHIFSAAGIFTVNLTVTNVNGCSDIYTSIITINMLPVANFSNTESCEGSSTQFTDLSVTSPGSVIVNYNWSFGDGGFSTQSSPVHTYFTYGLYNVTLTVVNSNGCTNSVTKQVLVKPKPVANFSFSTTNCIGNPVTFTDQSFVPPGGSAYIASWVWDFGDGSPPLMILFPGNPNVSHTYAGSATAHVVRLTVTTSTGCNAYIEKNVTSVPAPIANFFVSGATCELQPVQFIDFSQTNGGGSIVGWYWNFGDPLSGAANTSSAQNPVHVFSSPGTFMVTLGIVNNYGCTDTISKTVSVNQHPIANFKTDTVHQGTPATFTDLSFSVSGIIVSWTWDFGDGQMSSLSNPTHLYATQATYMTRLTVTDINGCKRDTLKPVIVLPPVNNPPATQTITNVIVGNGQTKCYNATQVITVAGNGTLFYLLPGGNATFIAGQKISFLPGTTVQEGCSMWGYIAPAGPYCLYPSMPATLATGDAETGSIAQSFFKINPNPTTGNFILDFTGVVQTDKANAEIYGMWGEKVVTAVITGEREHQFSLSGRPAGVYVIRVISGNRSETAKIIKQ